MTTQSLPRPKFYITEIGVNQSGTPVAVGWDFCGGCGKHINNCTCVGGVPSEPKYITAMRDRESAATAAKLAEKSLSTPVGNKTDPNAASPEPTRQVPLATTPGYRVDPVTDYVGLCTVCQQHAHSTDSDQNDDKTWTHHACQ